MSFFKARTAVLWLVLGLSPLLKLAAQAPQATDQPNNPDDPNFHFSIYFTGDVRGNLEPCG